MKVAKEGKSLQGLMLAQNCWVGCRVGLAILLAAGDYRVLVHRITAFPSIGCWTDIRNPDSKYVLLELPFVKGYILLHHQFGMCNQRISKMRVLGFLQW